MCDTRQNALEEVATTLDQLEAFLRAVESKNPSSTSDFDVVRDRLADTSAFVRTFVVASTEAQQCLHN